MAKEDLLSQGIAIFLIIYLHLSTDIVIILPWYSQFIQESDPHAPYILVSFITMNLLTLLIYWHYYLCCFTDPGTIPKSYRPEMDPSQFDFEALDDYDDDSDDGDKEEGERERDQQADCHGESGMDSRDRERSFLYSSTADASAIPLPPSTATSVLSASNSIVIEKKRHGDGPRFCKKCNVFKPPRSHHCSTCKKCILKMDHHCPWIANCVGFFNHGHFIRFLITTGLTSALYLILCCFRFYSYLAYSSHAFHASHAQSDIDREREGDVLMTLNV